MSTTKRFTSIILAAMLAVLLGFLASASATSTSAERAGVWNKGYTADANHPRSRLVVSTSVQVKAVCIALPETDILVHCTQGAKNPYGSHKLLAPSVYVIKADKQACGSTKKLVGIVVKQDGSWEAGRKVYAFHRYCKQAMAQNVQYSGKNKGVYSVNPICPAGTHRVRVWRLYPGPSGNITTPGDLSVPMNDGVMFVISQFHQNGTPTGLVYHVRGQRYWEFYQLTDRKVATSELFDAFAYPVMASPDASPVLKLVVSDCQGE